MDAPAHVQTEGEQEEIQCSPLHMVRLGWDEPVGLYRFAVERTDWTDEAPLHDILECIWEYILECTLKQILECTPKHILEYTPSAPEG